MSIGVEDVQSLADRVVDIARGRGDAEVRVTARTHGLTRFANSFIHQHVGEQTVSVDLRISVDGRTASSSTTDLRRDALVRLVDHAIDLAHLRIPDDIDRGLTPATQVTPAIPAPDDVTPDDRAGQVAAFVAAGNGLAAAGFVDSDDGLYAFANSAGQRVVERTGRSTVDGIHQTTSSAGSAHQTSRWFSELDGAAAGERAAGLARRGEDPPDLDPGEYEVVLSPECVASIITFLSYYGFSAKMVEEGQSFVRIGEQQFDSAFSLRDDVHDPRSVGFAFDAEGTPTATLDLVRDGMSTALVHDRITSARAGTESTGHAIPGGETYGPMAMNLVVPPGDTRPEELIGAVDKGLLITAFNYCRILDPRTQVVTGLTRNGTFLIERGELTRPVANLRFTQSFVEALAPGQLLAVGNDDRYAYSEFGEGMIITPSLRLGSFHFTGNARG